MKRKKIISVVVIAVFAFVGCNLTPAKVQRESARVAPQVQEIGSAVTGQKLGGDDLADWIALIGAGNAASAPFNPYAVPVGAGLALLSAVLGVVAKKKTTDAAKSNAKYQSHKQGVELSMKELTLENSEQAIRIDKVIYENIGQARQRNGV
jgi:hypothetical protein